MITTEESEGRQFTEFRHQVRSADLLSPAVMHLMREIRFTGRVTVVVQNGRVLKSGYEEGYFCSRPNTTPVDPDLPEGCRSK